MSANGDTKDSYTSKCQVDGCDIMVSTEFSGDVGAGAYDHFRKINGLFEIHTERAHPHIGEPDISFAQRTKIIFLGGKRKRSVILFLKAFL